MDVIKTDVFDWLKISQKSLNEIELEDIQLEPLIQKNIYKTVAKMMSLEKPVDQITQSPVKQFGEVTCKGFWVDNTKELVLYVWIGEQSRAIIIPEEGWNLRDDIIVN